MRTLKFSVVPSTEDSPYPSLHSTTYLIRSLLIIRDRESNLIPTYNILLDTSILYYSIEERVHILSIIREGIY